MEIVIGLLIGLAVGLVLWLAARREIEPLRSDAAGLREELEGVQSLVQEHELARNTAETQLEDRTSRIDELVRERDSAEAKLERSSLELSETKQELEGLRSEHQARMDELEKKQAEIDTLFKSIATDVAKASNEEFRKQAAEDFKRQRELQNADLEQRREAVAALVKPLNEGLDKLRKDYGGVEEVIAATRLEIGSLQETTGGLRQALSAPQQRGRWGELTLERVLEVSGMREHITYERQAHTSTDDRVLRPDAIIYMPQGLTVPVDAKTPLSSYLEAHDASNDAAQRAALEQHARSLMNHARQLGSKGYADSIVGLSPDFVVLFVPTETILDAAMTAQPTIWEDAWTQHRVLIASPGLLIALLRTIGIAWQQEDIQRNANAIADSAKELYSRLVTYVGHVDKVGSQLTGAVKAYNDSVGSYERRVLPQARRMEDLGAIGEAKRISEQKLIEETTRARTPG